METGAMGKAKPRVSNTDRYARMVARQIANGRPPSTGDLDLYFERFPNEIFAAFEGAAANMPPAGREHGLALGYLFLLQGLLEHLRYRAEQGYQDAVRLIADFQDTVAARAKEQRLDGEMLAFVAAVLQQAKIQASAELVAASTA